MKVLLEKVFGNALVLFESKKVKLPLYLKDGREFYDVQIQDSSFVLIVLMKASRFSSNMLMRQMQQYSELFKAQIVFGFDGLTTFQRKVLIENGIPFIARNEQIYLPFSGILFGRAPARITDVQLDRFSPAAQMLFLLLLYGEDGWKMNKGEAARKLSITPMSISRATRQLKEMEILEEEKSGTEIIIFRSCTKEEAYEKAEPYLINPIQKIQYYASEQMDNEEMAAGEYALAHRSDLGYPAYKEYARSKEEVRRCPYIEYDPDIVSDSALTKIQVWKYDPGHFGVNGEIDPVSLICSFSENEDERIHKCLADIREEIGEWKIET